LALDAEHLFEAFLIGKHPFKRGGEERCLATVLNVTAAMESITDGREELVQYVFDEFRYTPLQCVSRLRSHEATHEPRIFPPQKPARQIDDRPVERLQELLWVRRQRVPRIDLVDVRDNPQPVIAFRCSFGHEVVECSILAAYIRYQCEWRNEVQVFSTQRSMVVSAARINDGKLSTPKQ
jgi:hypothetical protein